MTLVAEHLTVRLYPAKGVVHAVDDVSWRLHAGKTLAIVGESGSGKTVGTLAPLGLLPPGVSADVEGSLTLDGAPPVLGREVGVVFQDPPSALNPLRRVGSQVADATGLRRRAARERAIELLELVGLPDPVRAADAYPHELSGGMLQRAMIAGALAGEPRVLIADEPTTALDPSMQDQVLDVLAELQARLALALLLITHDIGVVKRMADDIAVMYAGRIVEYGPAARLVHAPEHPYTQGLLAAIPAADAAPGTRFVGLEGAPPELTQRIRGCAFAPRCPLAIGACRTDRPQLVDGVSCHVRTGVAA
ncbi:ABC transporter ATP-binding protein [Solirubrobacter sp. CPCC 204708]|uniref:ABC transporter ATP-binding protein n=1 Tax=Solirubrobacter deserti TaxID=2282478 RepID=A0ABT4RU75_9ACTN|nr:ABC transporter ATP-binding protein [Solirubrobacter deserti]MBE2316339.1 ABC transporter ATP-binding protein [Solirubrobacter deserti]MDA0142129.1 ABC transporter ATP-binding protein [Solirubrobacter deserti]